MARRRPSRRTLACARHTSASSMSSGFRVVPAGGSAVTVQFEERIDRIVNQKAIALAAALDSLGVRGVRDVVPAFRTVTVYFDALKTDCGALTALIEREASRPSVTVVEREPKRVPVCYGGALGPDLAAVAAFGRMSEAEAVRAHTSTSYRVFM